MKNDIKKLGMIYESIVSTNPFMSPSGFDPAVDPEESDLRMAECFSKFISSLNDDDLATFRFCLSDEHTSEDPEYHLALMDEITTVVDSESANRLQRQKGTSRRRN